MKKSLLALGLVSALTFPVGTFAVTSSAVGEDATSTASSDRTLAVAVIGDSYTAGNGVGSYEPGAKGTSYRSTLNWGRNYVAWLNSRGVHATLENKAYGGATTADVLADDGHIAQISDTTDLVLLTIGGNDIEFATIVKQCFVVGMRDARSCENAVTTATGSLSNVEESTWKIFEALEAKLGTDAEVVLVGYPQLSLDRPYRLANLFSRESYLASDGVRQLVTKATALQADLVERWNAQSGRIRVHYVDSIASAFEGHEPDPSALSRNPQRWINEFLETETRIGADGAASSRFTLDYNNWYHPGITGHEKIAAEIERAIGVPASSSTVQADTTGIDVVFAIDATGSMWDDIEAVRANVDTLVADISARSSSARFAVVSYRDTPESTGDPNDYTGRVETDFTTESAEIHAAMARVVASGGGDVPETVYSGIAEGFQLPWRAGVRKVMVVLGDAGPKDPEPGTGYTAAQMAQWSADIDPVEVYAVDTGGLVDDSMRALVDATGGKAYSGSEADVPALIADAVADAQAKPFGWLQGPIVGTPGEELAFDARGSYSANGAIKSYEWDFDGDGRFDATTSDGRVMHTFEDATKVTARVRVTDGAGVQAVGTAPVIVAAPAVEDEDAAEFQEDKPGVIELLDAEALAPFPPVTAPSSPEASEPAETSPSPSPASSAPTVVPTPAAKASTPTAKAPTVAPTPTVVRPVLNAEVPTAVTKPLATTGSAVGAVLAGAAGVVALGVLIVVLVSAVRRRGND